MGTYCLRIFKKEYGNDSRDIELVAVAVRESVNTRNRFI